MLGELRSIEMSGQASWVEFARRSVQRPERRVALRGRSLGLAAVAAALALASPVVAESEGARASQGDAAEEAPVEVIFTGFVRRSDQGATVFVRMTGEVPVATDHAGQRLTYHLQGAKLGVPNNGNPLPTEHFGPPVSHVALVPAATGPDLVIELTDGARESATHRLVSQGRFATLRVELSGAQQ